MSWFTLPRLSLAVAALAFAACAQGPRVTPLSNIQTTPTPPGAPSLEEGQAPLPHIGIDPGVFQGRPGTDVTEADDVGAQAITPQTTFLACRNEPSGPYARLQTDPARTGNINFVDGQVYVPSLKAVPTAFPYLYLGGQPSAGVAADAGVYVNYDGAWIPFIAVAGGGGTRNLARETDAAGNVYVYRLIGDQSVKLRLSTVQDGELRLDVSGDWRKYQLSGSTLTPVADTGYATRTVVHPLATGWRADGADQVYKVMTTIAFPGQGNFALLSGDFAFLGSSWRDLGYGMTTGGRRLFSRAALYSACAAPRDVVRLRSTRALPRSNANLRLRRAAALTVEPGPTLDLSGAVGEPLRAELSLNNTGVEGSFLRYLVTPPSLRPQPKTFAGAVTAGDSRDLSLTERCPDTHGTTQTHFDLLYAVGETYTGAAPSALDGAQPGDLLYRRTPITVNLTCEDEGLAATVP